MSWHPVDDAAVLVPQLAAPSSAVPVRVAGVPLVLTRDTAGTLHALGNECPHQGATVCRAPQRGETTLECPNHYWVFDLDGTFRGSRLALERGRTAPEDPAKNLREHPCREVAGGIEVWL
ncbi:Rieske 2Fe-2S domain-containing protein [Kocuria sp.]|uniref:Rieske 2Fe-2S domain-containing protein n=1 Tax=Kocuria sp. TaxID=1871328 RepID=UPI0026DACE2D|nr:Rieske 2Fe-2S domain-containing protein [Kocuria sp.]MDO4918122.1 Rieske 2Fe-2S domain-containing protein [Kocuria sp.]